MVTLRDATPGNPDLADVPIRASSTGIRIDDHDLLLKVRSAASDQRAAVVRVIDYLNRTFCTKRHCVKSLPYRCGIPWTARDD